MGASCPKALITTHFHDLITQKIIQENAITSFWVSTQAGAIRRSRQRTSPEWLLSERLLWLVCCCERRKWTSSRRISRVTDRPVMLWWLHPAPRLLLHLPRLCSRLFANRSSTAEWPKDRKLSRNRRCRATREPRMGESICRRLSFCQKQRVQPRRVRRGGAALALTLSSLRVCLCVSLLLQLQAGAWCEQQQLRSNMRGGCRCVRSAHGARGGGGQPHRGRTGERALTLQRRRTTRGGPASIF